MTAPVKGISCERRPCASTETLCKARCRARVLRKLANHGSRNGAFYTICTTGAHSVLRDVLRRARRAAGPAPPLPNWQGNVDKESSDQIPCLRRRVLLTGGHRYARI